MWNREIHYRIKFLKDPTHALGIMNVILLHSNRWLVSANNVAIFRVKRTRIQIFMYFASWTWRWPHDWPKHVCDKGKVIPQQTEVAQGVPGRLRPRIFLTFGTTRVVGLQPYAPAAFTPGEIPGTHFQRLSWPQGTWLRRGEPRKKSPVTPPGIDPGDLLTRSAVP